MRRLARALGGEEEEEGRRRRRAVMRWRRSVCVVLAVRRWRALANQTTVLFRLDVGGSRPAVCVCGESVTASRKGQDAVSRGQFFSFTTLVIVGSVSFVLKITKI